MPATFLGVVASAAGLRDWDAYDTAMERALECIARLQSVAHDEAWLAQQAGELAVQAGEIRRGVQALQIARERWEKLGEQEAAAEISTRLERLRASLQENP